MAKILKDLKLKSVGSEEKSNNDKLYSRGSYITEKEVKKIEKKKSRRRFFTGFAVVSMVFIIFATLVVGSFVAWDMYGKEPTGLTLPQAAKTLVDLYKDGSGVVTNPYDAENSEPNFWLSCLLIRPEAMCRQVRSDHEALYVSEPGKSCPTQILETLSYYNAEGRPIWKPMHMQPIYHRNGFVTREGDGRAKTNAYISGGEVGKDRRPLDVGQDIFQRGLCLPSDNKMTPEQQDMIIEMVKSCF